MEENKNICPQCGTGMVSTFKKPALNLFCPKCGCRIATTKWDDIDLDDTNYKIEIQKINDVKIGQIKCISKYTGFNFIQSKKILFNGGVILECKATEVREIISNLEKENIAAKIVPIFPW